MKPERNEHVPICEYVTGDKLQRDQSDLMSKRYVGSSMLTGDPHLFHLRDALEELGWVRA